MRMLSRPFRGRPLFLACAGLTDHVICFIKLTQATSEFRYGVKYMDNLAKNLLDFDHEGS
jgi:hypothetical protein